MYIQDRFREERPDRLHAFMRAHSLATLVVATERLEGFPMPLEVVTAQPTLLRGHVNRTNHLSQIPSGTAALAIFQGPNAYLSPRWYVNGQASGRVAPSWNYCAVHACGRLRFIDEPQWMHAHLTALTAAQEAGRADPWRPEDAPPDFIDALVQRLVGIEIEVTCLEGKYFLSQHRTSADRENLAKQLRLQSNGSAADVAALIEDVDRSISR